MIDSNSVWNDVQKIRNTAPLVHNITNYVVMNNTANALLSIGASPIMAHAIEEMDEMIKIVNALVINIGTLSTPWIASMKKAAQASNKKNIPIILDPVGAGATNLRTETAHKLLEEFSPAVIRGNASEILALFNADYKTKGVDSINKTDEAVEAAIELSKKYNCCVCVSGAVDLVVQQNNVAKIYNGNPLMTKVTGLGCTASAISGAFAAINSNYFVATSHAMIVMGIAGEIAAEKSNGPGTLQLNFYDALYNLSEKNIADRIKIKI